MKRLLILSVIILLSSINALAQSYDDRIRIEPTKTVCRANYFYFDSTTQTIKVCKSASTQVEIGGGGGGGGGGVVTFSLNGLLTNPQVFATGTSGTDFTIFSTGSTHTFNLPTASALNRGLLSPSDFNVFNSKVTSVFGRTGIVTAQANDYNFNQLSGSVTDAQVPDTITINTAAQATFATLAGTGDSATAFFATGLLEPSRIISSITNERCLRINNLGQIVTAAGDCGSSSGITGTGVVNTLAFFDSTSTLIDSFFYNLGDATNPRFGFGGSTSAFPSFRRNGTNLQARLADNSLYTDLEVADETYDGTSWNANQEVPTKNAIRDKIESLTFSNIQGSITDLQVPDNITINGTNNVTWGSVSKTGSSLADLVTRSFAELTGSITDSQVPDNITISGTNNVTWASVNKTGSSLGDLSTRSFSLLTGTATDAQIPDNITINLATLATTATTATTANSGDSATAFFPSGTIEGARIITGAITNNKCLRTSGGTIVEAAADCGSGSGSGTAEFLDTEAATPGTATLARVYVRSDAGNEGRTFVGDGTNFNELLLAGKALTTKGDLLTMQDTTTGFRLPVGTNGQGLVSDSASTGGIKWGNYTNTVSLNYAQALANTCETLTMTLTGAVDGDSVSHGVINALASHNTTSTFFSWVSAADTISVRRCVITADGSDPAAGNIKVSLVR
jgi:hypothetical protein